MIEQLAYPVKEPVIVTQPFGARPEYYRQFIVNGVPLPGHEGIDFRAVTGDPVLCVAGGHVKSVGEYGNYGYNIRVQHDRGETVYESIYAHGAHGSALVKVGYFVEAGQLLMRADSTGNVQGSHLHFTLKCYGATQRNETTFPADIIDPTGLFLQAGNGAQPAKRVIIADPRLRVRGEPDRNAAIIGYVVKDEIVMVLAERDGWGLIAQPSGWIDLAWTQIA